LGNVTKITNFPPAKPILTRAENWFAWDTMANRLPKNIRNISHLHSQDFSPRIQSELLQLADHISSNKPIPDLSKLAWDYDRWQAELAPFLGKGWHEVDWFFAETYAFRLVLEVSEYFANSFDPFSEGKRKELESGSPFLPIKRHLEFSQSLGVSIPALNITDTSKNMDSKTKETLLAEAIHTCMWGNKADLSFSAGGDLDHTQGDRDLLLVNHEWDAAQLLLKTSNIDRNLDSISKSEKNEVHIIMDNSGAELAGDLVLAGTILDTTNLRVVLRPKLYPTYVSDTISKDIYIFLQKAEYHPDEQIVSWAESIRNYLDEGRLVIAPDDFWCRTGFMAECDQRIDQSFARAQLVVVKGDFNYRRFMRDTIWPNTTSGSHAMALNPKSLLGQSPILFLRTMKSDCLAGIDSQLVDTLDTQEPGWRIQGKRGLIHLVLPELG